MNRRHTDGLPDDMARTLRSMDALNLCIGALVGSIATLAACIIL